MFVTQADRKSIQLGFGSVGNLSDSQPFAHTTIEFSKLLIAERVIERQHRHRMGDLSESLEGFCPDPLGR